MQAQGIKDSMEELPAGPSWQAIPIAEQVRQKEDKPSEFWRPWEVSPNKIPSRNTVNRSHARKQPTGWTGNKRGTKGCFQRWTELSMEIKTLIFTWGQPQTQVPSYPPTCGGVLGTCKMKWKDAMGQAEQEQAVRLPDTRLAPYDHTSDGYRTGRQLVLRAGKVATHDNKGTTQKRRLQKNQHRTQ